MIPRRANFIGTTSAFKAPSVAVCNKRGIRRGIRGDHTPGFRRRSASINAANKTVAAIIAVLLVAFSPTLPFLFIERPRAPHAKPMKEALAKQRMQPASAPGVKALGQRWAISRRCMQCLLPRAPPPFAFYSLGLWQQWRG